MAMNFTEAVAAYQKIALHDNVSPPGQSESPRGSGFADALRDAAEGAMGALREGEQQSLKAAVGEANLNDVVTAIGKAELTLQTVVTLRDRVIQAYQEILRMPI